MSTLQGLLYVKHGAVGTRSEGPLYILQTHDGEYALLYEQRDSWKPDYHLAFFSGNIVTVEGELVETGELQEGDVHYNLWLALIHPLVPQVLEGMLRVAQIDFLWTPLIPTSRPSN